MTLILDFDYDDENEELDEILGWFDAKENKPLIPSEMIQVKEFTDRVKSKLRFRGPKSKLVATDEEIREARILNETRILKMMYPEGQRVIDDLILDVEKKNNKLKVVVVGKSQNNKLKVVVVGPKGKSTNNSFKENGDVNEKAIGKVNFRKLGPKKMTYKEAEDRAESDFYKLKDNLSEINRLNEEIQKNQEYADLPTTTEEGREKAEEKNEELENLIFDRERELNRTRERLGLTLRERIRQIFKKYGFSIAAISLVFTSIVFAIVQSIQQNSIAHGLKRLSVRVKHGLKNIGKKLAEILPGLIGPIASFIFNTAASVISFLGKHVFLVIVAIVLLSIERLNK